MRLLRATTKKGEIIKCVKFVTNVIVKIANVTLAFAHQKINVTVLDHQKNLIEKHTNYNRNSSHLIWLQ